MRDVIHQIVAQLRIENIRFHVKCIISEAAFATNALPSASNVTPYNALYGRIPPMLPSLEMFDYDQEYRLPCPGAIRHCHRLRELAIQMMVEGTARERPRRAMNSAKSQLAGQQKEINVGDSVDY